MRKKFKTIVLYSKDIIAALENVETTIAKVTIPALEELIKQVGDESKLVSTLALKPLNLKTDGELFKKLISINKKVLEVSPILREKIADELSDTITYNTSDVSARMALSLVSQFVYLGVELIPNLSSLITTHYLLNATSAIDKDVLPIRDNVLTVLGKNLHKLERVDYNKVVSIIGEVPTLNNVRREKRSFIPVEVISDSIANTFSIKPGVTLSYIKDLFTFGKSDNKDDILVDSFVGNPIMHIRLFLVDLESMYLDKLKEESKILELRLLELKSQNHDKPDPKLEHAILKYEEKVNKLNLKIARIMKSE